MAAAVRDDAKLERLFRLIVLTERRGLAQVRALLRFAPVASDPTLRAMFEVVERDEPSHFEPYAAWLARRGRAEPSVRERLADLAAHLSIVWLRLPLLALDLRLPRLERSTRPPEPDRQERRRRRMQARKLPESQGRARRE